ncbi:MarR family transcriptional regulator [Klenkia terrae]
MTDSLTMAPCQVHDAGAHALSDEVSRLMRVVHALKTTIAGQDDAARERAAHVLLFPLVRYGPQRQSALAEMVHADPSTVSRQVASLVERGLVRRVADATDGRASNLVVTDAGEAVTATMRAEREALFDRVTNDWTAEELGTFTSHLHRFVDDLTAVLPELTTIAQPDPSLPTPEKDR